MTRLNEQQSLVLNSLDYKDLLVNAGAGSGKTYTIIESLKKLLQQGISKDKFIVVTFTRKAAKEITDRLEIALGHNVADMWIGTFHSICLKIIREYSVMFNIPLHFSVYDEIDRQDVCETIKSRMFEAETWAVTKLLKMSEIEVEELEDEVCPLGFKEKEFVRQYHKFMADNKAFDYDMIIKTALKIVSNSAVSSEYQRRFEFIFIDEFQDTDFYQVEIFSKIAGKHFIRVGDDRQGIYNWRGADIQYIIDLGKQSEVKTINLETNYRSCIEIVRASENLITKNIQLPKNMKSASLEPGKVTVFNNISFFHNFLKENRNNLKNCAILYRIRALKDEIIKELNWKEIFYNCDDDYRDFWKQSQVKDIIRLLRYFANKNDQFLFSKIFEIETGMKQDEAYKLILEARLAGGFYPELEEKLKQFEKIQGNGDYRKQKIEAVLLRIHFFYQKTWRFYRANIVDDIISYCSDLGLITIQDFLDYLTSISAQDFLVKEENKISLMTIHSAKGLEWDNVIIWGCNEGIFPTKRDLNSLAECRRLFYVAMTRAKTNLYFYCSPEKKPSRFLSEIY